MTVNPALFDKSGRRYFVVGAKGDNTTRWLPDERNRPTPCPPVKESGKYWVCRAYWAEYAPELGWRQGWGIHDIEVNLNTHEAVFQTEDRGSYPWSDDTSVTIEVRKIVGWEDSPIIVNRWGYHDF